MVIHSLAVGMESGSVVADMFVFSMVIHAFGNYEVSMCS